MVGSVRSPQRRAEDKTQAMEWVHDPADQAATLIQGAVRCRVWRTAGGTWAALISVRGDATAAYSFATREAAQAWCETQVAQGEGEDGQRGRKDRHP